MALGSIQAPLRLPFSGSHRRAWSRGPVQRVQRAPEDSGREHRRHQMLKPDHPRFQTPHSPSCPLVPLPFPLFSLSLAASLVIPTVAEVASHREPRRNAPVRRRASPRRLCYSPRRSCTYHFQFPTTPLRPACRARHSPPPPANSAITSATAKGTHWLRPVNLDLSLDV